MSRKCLIEKNDKRASLCSALLQKRSLLKEQIYQKDIDISTRYQLVKKLHDLPRDSSKVRVRSRCMITGRARGVYRKFGLCRHKIRELAGECVLPGLTKSSW
jgi:small subunit ribosomal protein S14